MLQRSRGRKPQRRAAGWLATLGILALAACATPNDEGISYYVESPGEWRIIGPSKTDLNLPLVAPLDIGILGRRLGDGGMIEEIYTFHGVAGYVKTARMIEGSFPADYAEALGKMADFKAYAAGQVLPSGTRVQTFLPQPFLNGDTFDGKSLSRGYLSRKASAKPKYDNCFVARTAYLLQGYESGARSPDSVDTVVEVLLCGDLPRQIELERMLTGIEVVKDRDAYRKELARRGSSTI